MLDIQNRCPMSYSEREINMRARRKAKNKPSPQALLLMRVNGTALGVLDFIKDISFKDLSASLYFIAKDLQAEEFTRRYEAQIEYASVKPVEFADGLYKFFNDTAKYIKSNNLYSMFLSLRDFCRAIVSKLMTTSLPRAVSSMRIRHCLWKLGSSLNRTNLTSGMLSLVRQQMGDY